MRRLLLAGLHVNRTLDFDVNRVGVKFSSSSQGKYQQTLSYIHSLKQKLIHGLKKSKKVVDDNGRELLTKAGSARILLARASKTLVSLPTFVSPAQDSCRCLNKQNARRVFG